VAGKARPVFRGTAARPGSELSNPMGLALDRGNTLFIADAGNGRVRAVAVDGTISTAVQFEVPAAGAPMTMGVIQAVAVDETGILYVAHQKQVHRMPAAEPVVNSPWPAATRRGAG